MKKFLTFLLALTLSFSMVFAFGCNQQAVDKQVDVKYYSDAPTMLPLLKQGHLTVGLLPEPAATNLTKMASDKTWYRLDLQELYDGQAKAYPQAVIMVKQSLLATHSDLFSSFTSKINDNVSWAKQNVESAVSAVNSKLPQGVTPSLSAKNINQTVIDNCKIYFQNPLDAKTQVKNYINDIIELEPKSATAINDDFFFDGNVSGSFDAQEIKVFAPDGAPALSIAKFINDKENFGTDKTFNYQIVASSDIASKIQTGAGDIVILPINAASKLYKANAKDTYKMIGVVTHGNLYIMSSEKITSVNDLVGKTVGVIGKGLVPDLTFRAILKKNNISVNEKV